MKKIRTYDKIMRSISAVLSVVLAGIGEETEETRSLELYSLFLKI